jgi:hypothetical protein
MDEYRITCVRRRGLPPSLISAIGGTTDGIPWRYSIVDALAMIDGDAVIFYVENDSGERGELRAARSADGIALTTTVGPAILMALPDCP